jgi:hypothetical protein
VTVRRGAKILMACLMLRAFFTVRNADMKVL